MVVKVKILFFDERKKERKKVLQKFFLPSFLTTEEIFRGAVSGLRQSSSPSSFPSSNENTKKQLLLFCIRSPLYI